MQGGKKKSNKIKREKQLNKEGYKKESTIRRRDES